MARITPETLVYDLTWASGPRVSPDGGQVVYGVTTTDRATKKSTSHLWVRQIDGARPRRLTWSGEQNGGAVWSPDGACLAFVSDRGKGSGIFILPMDGGDPREVTRHNGPIGALAWSPDGRSLAYSALFDPDNPEEADPPERAAPRVRVTRRIDYKQDTRGYLADLRAQVWIVDVERGERRMISRERRDWFHPQWSPDGRTIAVNTTVLNNHCSQLALVAVDSGETTLIGPERGVVGAWAWSPAGDRLLLAAEPEQTWQLDLFVYEVASGEMRPLTDDLACSPQVSWSMFAPPAQPIWLDERHALLLAARAGNSGLYTVDTLTGAVECVTTWPAQQVDVSVDAGRRYLAMGHSSLCQAGEVVVFDRETGVTRQLTDQNAAVLGETPPADWERFSVQRGEFEIDAWLLLPPEFDPAQRYPLVIDVHGGPNGWYGDDFGFVPQVLASNGFLVVYANPRGSGSYGRRFAQLVTGDWGGEDYLDLMAVVDAVLERPYADPARTGIFGYSYGGYMTAWTISQTARFKAAVCGAPVFDLESFYGTSDIGYVWGPRQWGGKPHEIREWYAAHSPSTFAHQTRTPTLLLHGEADDRCPIGQGEQMFVLLHEAGCEIEFVRYPGANHLFLWGGEPAYAEDFMGRTLAWFQRFLQPEEA